MNREAMLDTLIRRYGFENKAVIRFAHIVETETRDYIVRIEYVVANAVMDDEEEEEEE